MTLQLAGNKGRNGDLPLQIAISTFLDQKPPCHSESTYIFAHQEIMTTVVGERM